MQNIHESNELSTSYITRSVAAGFGRHGMPHPPLITGSGARKIRELNQERSKLDPVDWPERTARTVVRHYNNIQYWSTKTALLIFPFLQTQGLKNPFLCLWGRVALSCGRVAHEGRTNASCGLFAQWHERYHGCEQWRIHGGGGDASPQSESGLWRVFW